MRDKRLEKGAARRRVILKAAIKCIATRGLCETTLDRIAEIAGVSRTLVVFHFKSKPQMLKIVLEEISTEYDWQWDQILHSGKNQNPEKKLLDLIDYDLKLPILKPELVSVWHTFWGEAKGLYRQFNARRDKKYIDDTCNLVKAIIKEGEYKNVNAKQLTTGLNSMLLGFWWTAHLDPKKYNYTSYKKIIKSYLNLHLPQHFN